MCAYPLPSNDPIDLMVSSFEDIIKGFYKLNGLTGRIEEVIVVLGLHESPIHRVLGDYFSDYQFARPKKVGFRGTYTYLMLAKIQPLNEAKFTKVFTFRTEFYMRQLSLHLLLERAEQLKVLLVASAEAFTTTDIVTSFEYLHKECESFLSLVPYNNRSVGLVIVADDDVNVAGLFDAQVYQTDLLTLFRQNHVTLSANGRSVTSRQRMRSLFEKVDQFGVTANYENTRFYHHKHFAHIKRYVMDYNQQLNWFSSHITDPINEGLSSAVDLADVKLVFDRFMNVTLSLKYDDASKRPLRLTSTLLDHGVRLDGAQRKFFDNLNTHIDLLLAAKYLSAPTDEKYLIRDMEFFHRKSLEIFFPDPNAKTKFGGIVSIVMEKIGLCTRLFKLQTPFSLRKDRPSEAIKRNLAKALELFVAELKTLMEEAIAVPNIFHGTDDVKIIEIITGVYQAEFKYTYIFVKKFGIDGEFLEPFTVFRKEFRRCLTELEAKLSNTIGVTITNSVRHITNEMVPQLRQQHRPGDDTRESALTALRGLKEVLKEVGKLRTGYRFVVDDFIKFVGTTNTGVSTGYIDTLRGVKAMVADVDRLMELYRLEYYEDEKTVGLKSGEEAMRQNITAILQNFKANTIAEVINRLVRQVSGPMDSAIEAFDESVAAELRLRYTNLQLDDPNDWTLWRDQTKHPFERIHLLQDTTTSIGQFVEQAQLFCDTHYLARPETALNDMNATVQFFEAIEREMVGAIETPINTDFQWGRHIHLSRSYLRNGALATTLSPFHNWLIGSPAYPTAVELLVSALVFATFIVKNLFK